jgi:hypothetical protein
VRCCQLDHKERWELTLSAWTESKRTLMSDLKKSVVRSFSPQGLTLDWGETSKRREEGDHAEKVESGVS